MENELYHYGILGMKWGIRRYQNADGSLTAAGKKHYGSDKVIGDRKRIDRARDADWIDRRKIGKIRVETDDGETHYFNRRGKEITGKKLEKIQKMSTMRDGLIKDLDPREVEYGKRLNDAYEAGSAASAPAGIVSFAFGLPAGLLYSAFATLGSSVVYGLSKEGRDTEKLRKELKKANKEAKDLLKQSKESSSTKWDPDAMFENAKNNGKYQIDFVEYTQNEEWSDKKALSEYKKYLKDPDSYVEKLRNR